MAESRLDIAMAQLAAQRELERAEELNLKVVENKEQHDGLINQLNALTQEIIRLQLDLNKANKANRANTPTDNTKISVDKEEQEVAQQTSGNSHSLSELECEQCIKLKSKFLNEKDELLLR